VIREVDPRSPDVSAVALEARNLRCQRGAGADRFELEIQSLEVRQREVLVILGRNGAGKSTLLRALAGLEKSATPGAVRGRGGVVTLVFQRPAAFSGSVAQNVSAALLGKGASAAERNDRVQRALARFEIDHLAKHDARSLSGGEMRRLALARAFVLDPAVLLLDEPFDDLDAEGQRKLSLDLQRAMSETNVALAMVTHDLRRALLLADRIAVLASGRLVQHGPCDEVLMRPGTARIAETVGMTNLAVGEIKRLEGEIAWIEVEAGLEIPTLAQQPVGERVWVGIRPEHLKLDVGRGDGLPIGKALVDHLMNDGLATVVALRARRRQFTTHLLSGRGLARRLSPGDSVPLAVDPAHVHARPLDPESERFLESR